MLHKAGFMFALGGASSFGIVGYETANCHIPPGLSIWTSRTCECSPLSDFPTWCGEDLRIHSSPLLPDLVWRGLANALLYAAS
jgi:hypothetical protein